MKRLRWLVLMWALLLAGCGKDTAEEVSRIAIPESVQLAIAENEAAREENGSGPGDTEELPGLKLIEDEEEVTEAPEASETATVAEEAVLEAGEEPETATVIEEAALEAGEAPEAATVTEESASEAIDEDGAYTTKEDVALYIHTYGKLPSNFITKKEAQSLGWIGGSLEDYAPGKCIGGSYFGNYEEKLPVQKGRKYYECDIDTLGAAKRGAKRIIYSNDGLIYYTGDHYETFEQLYGEE